MSKACVRILRWVLRAPPRQHHSPKESAKKCTFPLLVIAGPKIQGTLWLGHELGAMYQNPTDKSVETTRQISHRTFTLWGGEPYLSLVEKYSSKFFYLADPLFGGELWTSQKNPSGPFI